VSRARGLRSESDERCVATASTLENRPFALHAVVILPGWHFRAVLDGYLGGEGIWARSTVGPALPHPVLTLKHLNPRSSRSTA
jgi:hypothetical protein